MVPVQVPAVGFLSGMHHKTPGVHPALKWVPEKSREVNVVRHENWDFTFTLPSFGYISVKCALTIDKIV